MSKSEVGSPACSLRGKVTIVTGASSGIGAAVARRFGAGGARVGLIARDAVKLERVRREVTAEGGEAVSVPADLSIAGGAADSVERVEKALGNIDVLVNCAGIFLSTPLGATNLEVARRILDINVLAIIAMTEAVAAGMRTRRNGAIVNLASVAGVMAVSGYAAYCASKAAVIMLTRTHARELAPYGIRVNALAPGNTETPLNASVRADTAAVDAFQRMTPSGRAFSSPEDMAEAVVFLASGRCAAAVGAVLIADEGLSLGV